MDTTQHNAARTQPLAAAIPSNSTRWLGYGLVLLAGTLWACIGLFFRTLQRYDLPPTAIALNRAAVSGLTLLALAPLRRKKNAAGPPPTPARVPAGLRRDLGYFAFYAFELSAFFLIYVEAVNRGSVALASVLLYTAPVWVVLFARARWGEPLTPPILAALGLAVAGSGLVALGGAGDQGGGPLGSGGGLAIALGLLSGVAYAGYSLLSNEGLRRGYEPATMVLYVMLGGALLLLPFQDWSAVGRALATPGAWPALLGVGWLSSLLAPVCYAAGQRRVGASTASILATVEPALAALLAWAFLGERLAPAQLLGGGAILAAVLLIARRPGAAGEI